jgi:hypothetical protein
MANDLRISSCKWSDEAARVLEASTQWFSLATVEDYKRLLERDTDAQLYRLDDAEGKPLGFAILKIERFSGGAEGVIIAAAAQVEGVELTELLMPRLESLFDGVSSYRITTAREGLVWKLNRMGWKQTHTILRKAA